jgi:hypothetical protein
MEKGIKLSLTKSLADFNKLLDKAIKAVSSKKLSTDFQSDDSIFWKFRVGKNVLIVSENKEDEISAFIETTVFWVGYGWEEDEKGACLWLEFDAKTCPPRKWEKINQLIGTSGKYYSEIDFKFTQKDMNAWVYFCLREEYLKQFYEENADINTQRQILTGFINEVMEKL